MKSTTLDLNNLGISFIGGGQMAQALISRLVQSGKIEAKNIAVSDISSERLILLGDKYGISTFDKNSEAIGDSEVIVIAVKPQQINEALKSIQSKSDNKLLISIAAGIKSEKIEKISINSRVIRVMPNTAAMVGRAISAVSRGSRASEQDVALVVSIFSLVGEVMVVDEKMQDAVTAISGSGPAYFFYFTEALIKAAIKVGFSQEEASVLALNTIVGSAELLKVNNNPEDLRKMVTSPNGTTAAAIKSFEENNLSAIVETAVQEARLRAIELSEEE